MKRMPHEVVPEPAAEAGAPAHARYHWARAQGWNRLVDHLAGHPDPVQHRHMMTAVGNMHLETSKAYLLDALVQAEAEDHDADLPPFADATAAELHDTLMAPHCVGPLIWQSLAHHGVDPATIDRFRTPDEPTAQRPEVLTLPDPDAPEPTPPKAPPADVALAVLRRILTEPEGIGDVDLDGSTLTLDVRIELEPDERAALRGTWLRSINPGPGRVRP